MARWLPLERVPDVLFIGPFPKRRLRPLHELYSDMVRKGLREQMNAIHGDLIPGLDHLEVLTEGGNAGSQSRVCGSGSPGNSCRRWDRAAPPSRL